MRLKLLASEPTISQDLVVDAYQDASGLSWTVLILCRDSFYRDPVMTEEDAVKALAALSQSTRLSIFQLLAAKDGKGLSAGVI